MSAMRSRRSPPNGGARPPSEAFRLQEMVDRPMGVLDATALIIREPGKACYFSDMVSFGPLRAGTRAAWALGYAAAKGADISQASEALSDALTAQDEDLARASAYALAFFHAMRGERDLLEALESHQRVAVRWGARLAALDKP
jgi:hypothetical protein